MPPDSIEKVEMVLQNEINAHHTPGIYYAFFDVEKVIYTFSGGHADIKNQLAIDAQTAFYAFSLTKTFTATAILQLAEEGALHLDDPVKTHLPDFPYGNNITLRHLLAHSSGLPNPLPVQWIHRDEDHPVFNEVSFFRRIFQKNAKTRSKPNDKFAYSNLGYVVLGQVIECVSGLPYQQYIKQRILAPLGIADQLDFTRRKHWKMANGYHKAFSFSHVLLWLLLDRHQFKGEKTNGWVCFKPYYVNGSAYGGLLGFPGALITYARDFIKPRGVLLSLESREAMFQENILNNGRQSGMCVSWFCGQLNGQHYLAHAGGGGGYYCELRIYPETGFGSLLMTNRSGFSDERFLDKLDKAFLAG